MSVRPVQDEHSPSLFLLIYMKPIYFFCFVGVTGLPVGGRQTGHTNRALRASGNGTYLCIGGQIFWMCMFTAGRAFRIAEEAQFGKLTGKCIVGEQAPGQRITEA